MFLKESIDIQQFLKDVLKCHGNIIYSTTAGDCLNLKSQLSQFVFVTAYCKDNDLLSGQVVISEKADQTALRKYLIVSADS